MKYNPNTILFHTTLRYVGMKFEQKVKEGVRTTDNLIQESNMSTAPPQTIISLKSKL